MNQRKRLSRALSKLIVRERDRRDYGRLVSDISQIQVAERPEYVRVLTESGTITQALNRGPGRVPLRANLAVRLLRRADGELVVDGTDDRLMEGDLGAPDNPYGVPPHPFTVHIDVPSSYIGSAGQVLRVDGDEEGLEFAAGSAIVGAAIDGATEQTTPDLTDRFALTVSGVLKWMSYTNLRNAIRDYYNSVAVTLTNKSIDASANILTNVNTSALADDAVSNAKAANMAQGTVKGRQAGAGTGDPEDLTAAQLNAILLAVLADGTVPLTADWDIGEDRAIQSEKLAARDVEGLGLYDDGGNAGWTIKDGGNVESFVASGATTGDILIDHPTRTIYLGRLSATSGHNSRIIVRNRNGDPYLDINPSAAYFQFAGTVGANVAIGNFTNPQGKLHVHDNTYGNLDVSKTNIVGSAQTIIPDGTNDVANGCFLSGIARNNTPGIAKVDTALIVPGGNADVVIGADTLRFAVSAGGALTVIRQAGSATWTFGGTVKWL